MALMTLGMFVFSAARRGVIPPVTAWALALPVSSPVPVMMTSP